MTSQRAVLDSLNVTARQMSRGGSSGTTDNSGGALLAQLEDMNQRSLNIAARATDIRSVPACNSNVINSNYSYNKIVFQSNSDHPRVCI